MIIPKPLKLEVHENHFTLKDNFIVYLDSKLDLELIPIFIRDHILPPKGFHFQIERSEQENAQLCFIYNGQIGKEGYELKLTTEKLTIAASTKSGHFYGLVTFKQLFLSEIFSDVKSEKVTSWDAPCVTIEDCPQYSWRGMLLDCSRHFFTVSEVKKFIYWMSLHKLNIFHWHLTDDEGWRFECKKYPKLTEIGSLMLEKDGTNYKPYFYTQEEMKEIVSYAKNLCVTVVPEIDMPGHSESAFNAYPEFFCHVTIPEDSEWSNCKNFKAYCISSPSTINFLKDILAEVIEIFDSEYIHIGGDQVAPVYWEECDKCKSFMKEKNIKSIADYQTWFSNMIADFLHEKGRKMIGWDEILNYGLEKENAVMIWREACIGNGATKLGHPIVMTPNDYLYFDHCQFSIHEGKEDPYSYFPGPCSTLVDVYCFNPLALVENKDLILGVEACAWAEVMFDFNNVQCLIE